MTDAEEPTGPKADWVADHAQRYVATDGEDGHLWNGVPTLLLTTRGRTSGHLYRTPLIYGRDGDGYVVVASYGGAPEHPSWYRNLVKDPDVTIQVGNRVMPGRARTATEAERVHLWPAMTAIWPDYDAYQAKTSRTIPLVVIEPT